MRYEAVTAFFCLAILARFGGYAVSFFFPLLNAGSFWQLPFSDAGIPLFYLIASGGFELESRVETSAKSPLFLCLLPVVCFLMPLFLFISGYLTGIWPLVYGFLYVTPLVVTLILVIRNWPVEKPKGFYISLFILGFADLTPFIYFLPIKHLFPDRLPEALAPLALILFTRYMVMRKEEIHG
jgi:hypothetical protein